MRNLVLLSLLLLLTPVHSARAEIKPICEPTGTEIVFGNGMFNSRDEALESLQALEDLEVGKPLESDPSRLRYTLAYNMNEALLQQLMQVYRQKVNDLLVDFWLWKSGSLMPPDWFRVIEKSLIAADLLLQAAMPMDSDLKKHVQMYRESIEAGRRVLLVSHSQGNFYANESFRNLSRDSKDNWGSSIPFGNVQVATPANQVASRGPYFTFAQDLVIQGVRAVQGALPPNLEGGAGTPPEGDYLGHNFIKAYLRSKESRGRIVGAIADVGNKLSSTGGSAFRVSFETDADSQIELRIREPGSKSHIAPSGNLAPQGAGSRKKKFQFQARCADLKEGEYEIALDTLYAAHRESLSKFEVSSGGLVHGVPAHARLSQNVKSYYQPQFLIRVTKSGRSTFLEIL